MSTATAFSITSPPARSSWTVRLHDAARAPQPARPDGERPRRHQHRRLPAVDRVRQHRRRRAARSAVHHLGGGQDAAERRAVHAAPRRRRVPFPAPRRQSIPASTAATSWSRRTPYQDGRFDAARRASSAASAASCAPASRAARDDRQSDRHVLRSGRRSPRAASCRSIPTPVATAAGALARSTRWGTRSAGANRTQIWLSRASRVAWDLIDQRRAALRARPSAIHPDAYGNVTHSLQHRPLRRRRASTRYTTYATPQSGSQVYDRPSKVRDHRRRRRRSRRNGSTTTAAAPTASAERPVAAGNLKRVRARLSPTDRERAARRA